MPLIRQHCWLQLEYFLLVAPDPALRIFGDWSHALQPPGPCGTLLAGALPDIDVRPTMKGAIQAVSLLNPIPEGL